MTSGREAAEMIKHLKWKLMEEFEEDVEGLCDELGSQGLITLDDMRKLLYIEDPIERVEKIMDIILQKEEDCQKFLSHLENMIPRFPALRNLSQHFPENKLKTFHKLLNSLNMNYSTDSKLTLRHTLEIGEEILNDVHPQTIQDIPWHVLRKLMALNRAALNTHYENDTQINNFNESNVIFDSSVIEEESSSSESIHPLDVLCVLLHCSDSFLQQEIVTKMAMCQFAVPLILPAGDGSQCTFMLWAMRDIVKKWRPQSLADSKGFNEENVVNIPMPIFSFIRLGNTKLSKSKILNQVLSPAEQHHNFFIHDDMEGGNIERQISDGLVEMSWYFPCGNSDVFPEPITVANLRGDLETNWDQFTFLTRVSSAVFIFIESISDIQFRLLSSCSNPGTQLYLIVTPEKGKKTNMETSKHIKNLMTMLKMNATNIIRKTSTANDAALVKKIQNSIENVIKNCQKKKQNLCSATNEIQSLHISVDENSDECRKTKVCASKITSVIKDVEEYKKETLKLQGDLWKELSKVEKELCRMAKQGAKNAEEYQSELIQKRNSLHKEQSRHYVPTGIKDFTEAITDLSKAEKHYFLKWMKFELDSVARNNISMLQSEYKEKCKSKSETSELKQLDQKISNSSLGIEHFVRELGQFYEAEFVVNKENNKRQFTKLPGIAAELLLDGFPLELIDGDASNIPLQWITDVLTELDNKTGGQCKMRIITVLGVQSTGKSTLLNTMFGLQFPVASGRCTRGAFMTLLKVKENFQEELGCHFILVIDTEGLKAPELASLEDSYEHDNELATLVVGLSDITIINMSMENTSEMKDILQIVVHAFLRMEEIGKKPSCQFVHQNVSDVSAHEKNMRDRKKFLEQLDEMTRVAANMEKKLGITCFRDVIDYDPEKHNWYIPGLWQGVPPMAPVNFGYSENVYKLKKYLLGFLKSQNSDRTQCKITDFIKWVESLWRAVKYEKFIFSFRNSLVAEAYTKLSVQYSLWDWDFKKKVHSWMTTKETHIRNQSARSLNAKMHRQFISELQSLLLEEEDAMLKLLEKYFENKSENVHLIERYKEDFCMSVRFLKKELERNTLSKLHEAFSIQKGKFKIREIQKTCQKLMEEELTNLLKKCKERNCELGDIDAEKEFEEMWKKTLCDLQIEELRRRNIGQTILQQLKNEMCVKGGGINESLSKVMSLDNYGINRLVINKSHVDKSFFSRSRKALYTSQTFRGKIEGLATILIDMCNKYIKEKVDNKGDYDDTFFQELLHMINDKLKDKSATKLHFSLKFELDIKLCIFGKASRAFQGIHDRFIQEKEPKSCLEKFKPQYLATFESIFHGKNDEYQSRAEKFCELCLKPALTEYILGHLGKEIIDDILQNSDNHIFHSRSAFQLAVLEDLLKKKEFESYSVYINHHKVFLKRWIRQYITEKYQITSTLEALEEKLLSSIIGKIKEVLRSEECLNTESIVTFLESFCKLLDKEIVISQNEMTVITFHNTANVRQFSEDILCYLPNIKQHMLSDTVLSDIGYVLNRVTLKPQEELLKKVISCGKQCPFCKVPCENAGSAHREHSASLHRPQGLGKHKSNKDGTLVTNICSTAVVSNIAFRNFDTGGEYHPFKDYRKYYPDWAIQPDPNLKSSDYWKYIFVHFNKEFAEEYIAKPAKLPKNWKKITEDQALASLQESIKIKRK